jgi:DNA helicase HerA-like ATPase
MLELARFCSANPSPTLQAAILLDEADLYLPAQSRPASKPPVENALRRFRSSGFSVMLATQSPGDFDYKCRQNIGTWLVGKVTQSTAIQKLRPVFPDGSEGILEKLGQHSTGEFCLVRDGKALKIKTMRNLLPTEQMSDPEILRAAARSRSSVNSA